MPQASHAEKLARYYAGRLPETVAFPEGLHTHGVKAIREQTYSIDVKALFDQHLRTPLWRQFDYAKDDRGLRLVEIVPGGVVDHFGFLPGDIVTKIDDIPIARIEDLQYLLHPNSMSVRVEFKRESTPMTHTYLLQ
jgi:S1-C subfamily serine protease